MPTLKQCQERYDNLLPDDPEEEEEREGRRRWRDERRIEAWEFERER